MIVIKKYVQLLKAYPLTAREINNYSNEYISENGEFPFDVSENCNENNQTGCYTEVKYEDSSIKKLVDNWAVIFNGDLVEVNGHKAILPNRDEISNDYDWKFINKSYWSINSGWIYYYIISKPNENIYNNRYDKNYVRPVIYLRKSAIEIGCGVQKNINNNYIVGSTIMYNNNNYCVIKTSTENENYVTLLKQDPLTYEELGTYNNNNNYDIEKDNVNNLFGKTNYYKSNTCYWNSWSVGNYDHSGCINNYDSSNIKNIVNNWSNSFNNDLVEVNNYKARLITKSELNNLGHTTYRATDGAPYYSNKSDIKCLYIDSDYWTMNSSSDGNYYIDIVSKNNSVNQYVYEQYAVRPVINLKKCALTNTCE